MSFRLNVVSTNCYVGQMSVGQLSCRPNVVSAKCRVGQMSCWPNVASAKCRVGQMSCRPNVVSAKCRVGQISCRPNVCRPNAVSAKSLSAKCRVGHMSVGQMSVGQMSVEGWLLVSVLQCSGGMLCVAECVCISVPACETVMESSYNKRNSGLRPSVVYSYIYLQTRRG